MESSQFNAARHQELNLYFKEAIKNQLGVDPHLRQKTQAGRNLDLQEIIDTFGPADKALWEEYMALDQLKMQQDLQNYLAGNGSPSEFQQRFYRTNQDTDQNNPLW